MLTIIYLGLAKTLSPTEIGIQYIQNEKGLAKLVKSPYSTAILIDTHATGFLIKTYYQKYRIINADELIEDVIVRTNKEFAKKNLANIGLSLFRRTENTEEFLPLPPGSSYLGNRQFGDWKENKKGKIVWRFNKVYKNFPKYLGWGKFRPDEEFYQQMRSSITLNQPFYGPHTEFGPQGRVTKKNFPHFFNDERMKKVELKTLLIDYFRENFAE